MKILNSQQIGNGNKNIIILHGFLGMGDNWRGFAKKLDQIKYRIHLVDHRNHGKSFWHENMSYDDMAKDLLVFCNSQKIDKSIINNFDVSKYTFTKARYFANRYGLTFLSNDFFKKICNRQLIFL